MLSYEADNLVVNGDFEVYNKCPVFYNFLTVSDWYSTDLSTPDYYNLECVSDSNNYIYFKETTNGLYNSQSGKGYVGFIPLSPNGYMEHIQSKLIIPLAAGKKYSVSFYIYFVNTVSYYSTCKIGVYFSRNKVLYERLDEGYYQFSMNPKYVAQVENGQNNFLKNPNWELFSGEFFADGNETYITIGCFFEKNALIEKQCSEYLKKYATKNEGKIPALEATLLESNLPSHPMHILGKNPYYFIDNVKVYQITK